MSAAPHTVFEFGDFRVDARKRLLTRRDGASVALTPKHFDALLYLVENAGEVLEKDRIMSAVWPGVVVEENNLNQTVSQLRRVLGDDGAERRYILTVPRRGYQFVADVVRTAVSSGVGRAEPSRLDTPRRAPLVAAAVAGLTGIAVLAWITVSPSSRGLPVGHKAEVAAAAGDRSIAVLPFTNFSGAREDEYFSDGMTEDMVTQLAQISGLKVISRASILEYKGTTKPLRDIARELGVSHILQGSVRRDEKRFRITAQLVDPAREGPVWARSYDRDIKDVLAVQSEVASEIAAALKTRLLGAELEQLDRRARSNPEAYLLYRRGKHLMGSTHRTRSQEWLLAREYFERVTAMEPGSALGYAGQAEWHFRSAMWHDNANRPAAFARAKEIAERALAADDTSSEAHLALAAIHAHGFWDWPRAEASAKRAVELNPGNAETWALYGAVLESQGRLEQAHDAKRRAMSLDPLNQEAVIGLAFTLINMGRCDLASKQARFNIESGSAPFFHKIVLARCHEVAGEFGDALELYRQLDRPWMPGDAINALQAAVDHSAGASATDRAAAYWRTRLVWQKKVTAEQSDQHYFAAAVASQAGERDEAFRYLELAIDRRDRYLPSMKVDHQFRAIRDDPRFAAALRRLKLAS
jgi:TolB-like protein/DNA-binding winged helix-turn-helix (wHTH) protein/Flp pilus assembly protein TadD